MELHNLGSSLGFMRERLASDAPMKGEDWKKVFDDIESVVMDGMTHWHAPGFFAYFPTAVNYPAMLGSILADATACIGFTWVRRRNGRLDNASDEIASDDITSEEIPSN